MLFGLENPSNEVMANFTGIDVKRRKRRNSGLVVESCRET